MQRVIVLEEDLEIAPDFFELFGATAALLDDPAENLLAVSAFNDNGLKKLVDEAADAGTLLRSDFFPGLGWMLTVSGPAFRRYPLPDPKPLLQPLTMPDSLARL